MITAGKAFEREYDEIAAADIETAADGSLLDINLAYGDFYATYTSWDDWLHGAEFATNRKGVGRIWFHNGGRFDLVGLVVGLLRGDFEHIVRDFSCTLVGGSIIEVKIKTGGKKWIRLADSFRLMPSSLEELAGKKGFGFAKGKDDVPENYKSQMQAYKRDFADKYHAYHKRDTLLLLEILNEYRRLLNEIAPIGNLRLTCASTALAVFRIGFLDYEIITPGRRERDFTRLSYQGGRTEFVGMGIPEPHTVCTFEGVKKYDVISMYPAIMAESLFPIKPGFWSKRDATCRYDNGVIRPGCYRARFEQRTGSVPLLKPRLVSGEVAKDAAWSGETYATYLELRELESTSGTVKILEGVIYEDEAMVPLFKRFVSTLYAWRLEAEKNGNLALKLVIKLIMNNLYGKFGQGETGETMSVLTDAQVDTLRERGAVIRPLPDLGDDVYSITEELAHNQSFPAVASFVTAGARVRLLSMVNRHRIPLIYCDTDSFHTQQAIPDRFVSDSGLGMFKLESRPGGHEMAYGGRKLYVDLTEQKTRAKGIPKRSHDINLMHAAFESRAELKMDYNSPASIKTAVRKKMRHPNEFLAYSRRIKAEPSSKEKGLLR